ncbi:hypothetical protein [Lactiplantibacillus paraplantarum]|uniref:hypothetical protein n=1 Tax=Lactiplantibacillus paraplantarum TaxID=60520 RepID=UPI0020733545|nr:hypothetical protein [Lactiplantibacillus paraplantarum]
MKCPTIVRHIHGRNAPFPAHTGDPYFNKESGQPLIALLDANLAGPVEPFATYIEDVISYKIYIEEGEKIFELLYAIINIIKYLGMAIVFGLLTYALIYIMIGVFTMN